MTDVQKDTLKSKVVEIVDLAKEMFPTDCSVDITINDGYVYISARMWDKPNENGNYNGVKRKDYMDICRFDGIWASDYSDKNNDRYMKEGILL